MEPFILSPEVAQTLLAGATSSTYPVHSIGFPAAEPTSKSKPGVSRATAQPSIPPTSSTASSSPDPPSSGNNAALMEQVEMLKDGVARLRDLHDSDRHALTLTFQSETPPESS